MARRTPRRGAGVRGNSGHHGWIVRAVTPVQETPRKQHRPHRVPAVAELRHADLVAAKDDPNKYFDERARVTAEWLRANGVQALRSVRRRESERLRTPDGVFDHHSGPATIEMKTLDEASDNAIYQGTRIGRRQSRIIVLDGRRKRLTHATAESGIKHAVREYGGDVDQVIAILADGSALGWRP